MSRGPVVAGVGGLHIVGTERTKPGGSTSSSAAVRPSGGPRLVRFFLSLEDDLMGFSPASG